MLHQPVRYVWHRETDLKELDAVILPGGFSYGDYLRPGAIARLSPVVGALQDFSDRGGFILGICNGFQVLTEVGLLPGSLLRNTGLKFICDWVELEVVNNQTAFTHRFKRGQKLRLPIAHNEGRYTLPPAELEQLRLHRQVIFTYLDNPNGSVGAVAGVLNEQGNVLGMMPHPERGAESLLGSQDGLDLFLSLSEAVVRA